MRILPLNDEVIRVFKAFQLYKKRLNADFDYITALIEKLGLKFCQNEFDELSDQFSTNQLLE